MPLTPTGFLEEQRFEQWWIRLLMGINVLASWGSAAWLIALRVRGVPGGIDSTAGLLATAVLLMITGSLGLGLVLFLKLIVCVDSSGVRIRFWPLRERLIAFNQIRRCHARRYRPVVEYGGWGIRYSPGWGTAYNVRGNQGVQLELVNGKKVLIGSQSSEELAAVISRHLPSSE